MDAVVLAAGKGSRLEGVVPAYFKPLIVIDGMPLITRICDQVRSIQAPLERTIVVASQTNAAMIHECVQGVGNTTVIIQNADHRGTGPGIALKQALKLCVTDYVCVAMGDNIVNDAVFRDIEKKHFSNDSEKLNEVVTTHLVPWSETDRFTRWHPEYEAWIENEELDTGSLAEPGYVECWVGPLVVHREKMLKKLWNEFADPQIEGSEVKIGEYLSPEAIRHRGVAYDIGTRDGLFPFEMKEK